MKRIRATFVCANCGRFFLAWINPRYEGLEWRVECARCAPMTTVPPPFRFLLAVTICAALVIVLATAWCQDWRAYDDGREWPPSLDEPLTPTPTPNPSQSR